ncbi:hypothetical protein [Haloferax sp. ATB1]|uniref:hypothetical protein n=1 Tax=Haloferax sp. ATB1 TaxID=1508454 RepID=UPI0005B21BFA|nr:hypothetical protein [Haloferax sp. ATB1]
MRHNDNDPRRDEGTERSVWEDDEELYRDVDTEQLPGWWADAIEEFRNHNLRPYKPPRFDDDMIVPPVVQYLESVHNITIRFMNVNMQHGDDWGIYFDGTLVSTVSRERTPAAYSRYGITSGEFKQLVHDYVTDGTSNE